jgi:hypothetical protein
MPATPQYPHFGFFPALPFAKNIALGDWLVGNPPADVAWRSERFKSLAELLMASFEKIGFKNGARLWHRERGFDGALPTNEEISAIQAAIRFAVLDANDQIFGNLNAGYYLATTENAELFLQPIVEEDGSIAYRKGGSLKSVLAGGYKIGQETPPLPDATVAIAQPTMVSGKLAAAVFGTFIANKPTSGHLHIALEWHAVAMSNPAAVTLQQRIIAIKTGFEALLGTSDSRECAGRLRGLFESTAKPHLHLLPWAGVLWSPRERTNLVRHYTTKKGKQKTDTRSELEDWFMTLAAARNSVIHDGLLSIVNYAAPPERPLSRYKGQLLWTGERVLREAIKASIGAQVLLCARLEEEETWAELDKIIKAESPALATPSDTVNAHDDKPPQPPPAAAVPARTVAALLLALGCKAANEVQFERIAGTVSNSEYEASEGARSARGNWSASADGNKLLITEDEHALLEAEGAEEKLPDHFPLCD